MTGTTGRRLGWTDRAGALCGAAYVLLIMVGNDLAVGGGEPAHPTGAWVLAELDRQAGSTAAAVGLGMEILGFVAFAFFLGWFADLVRRHSRSAAWLGTVALVGGTATIAVKVGSALPGIALFANRATVDDTTARLLNDMGSAGFVVSFLTFGLFLVAAGLGVLASGVLGGFTGWTAVVLGAGSIAIVVVGRGGIESNPVPFLLGLLWVLAVSVRLAWRGPRRFESAVGERDLTAAGV